MTWKHYAKDGTMLAPDGTPFYGMLERGGSARVHVHAYKPVGQTTSHPSIVRCDCGHTLHDALPSPGWSKP